MEPPRVVLEGGKVGDGCGPGHGEMEAETLQTINLLFLG